MRGLSSKLGILAASLFFVACEEKPEPLDYPESRWAEHLEVAKEAWQFDTRTLSPGQLRRTQFLGRTVMVYRRHADDVERMMRRSADLEQGFSFQQHSIVLNTGGASELFAARVNTAGVVNVLNKRMRSLDDEIFVFFGESPYAGCAISVTSASNVEVRFEDPCTGAVWDEVGLPIERDDDHPLNSFFLPLMLPPYAINEGIVTLGGDAFPDKLPRTDRLVLQMKKMDGEAPTRLGIGVRWNLPNIVQDAISDGAGATSLIDPPNEVARASALNVAISESGRAIITMLLDAGAEPTGRDFEKAQRYRRPDVIALFCERGFEPSEHRELVIDPPLPDIQC